jgi:hypothetical protein
MITLSEAGQDVQSFLVIRGLTVEKCEKGEANGKSGQSIVGSGCCQVCYERAVECRNLKGAVNEIVLCRMMRLSGDSLVVEEVQDGLIVEEVD